jgi:SAM-dependent methyltransferase
MSENGYFKNMDLKARTIGGMELLPSWWSRPCEYAWARQFAHAGDVVADMGCGWSGRPFKEELADLGCNVYAIDADPRVLELPPRENVQLIVRSFLEPMDDLPQFDRIFCLSVLEDLTKDLSEVLYKFAHKLKDDGLIVITFDTPYDDSKPTPTYPGLNVYDFYKAMKSAGLELRENSIDMQHDDLVHHDEWNLCVMHFVLRHVE